jgi:hypothetical protein
VVQEFKTEVSPEAIRNTAPWHPASARRNSKREPFFEKGRPTIMRAMALDISSIILICDMLIYFS